MRNEITIIYKRQGLPRKKTILLGKTQLEVYSIGWLSLYARISNPTIRLWERKKILPRPILKLPGKKRFYTPTEITLYSNAIEKHYSQDRDLNELRNVFAQLSAKIAVFLKKHSADNSLPEDARSLPVNFLKSQLQNESSKIKKDSQDFSRSVV